MEIINTVCNIIGLVMSLVFAVCFSYQVYYVILTLFFKAPKYEAKKNNRYAVLIPCRNEEAVVANLINSVRNQNYPQDLIDIYVCADNCTDNTAKVARKNGAFVFERFDEEHKGKGFALNFTIKAIFEKLRVNNSINNSYNENTDFRDYYNGYFIFDADNTLDSNFVLEMNKVFDSGYKVVTGFRNSSNFGSSWVSAASSIYFMRESTLLNKARMIAKSSAMVSGTGFLVHSDILKKMNGWSCHSICEDLEFTASSAIHGVSMAYCDSAIFYDEQPIKFAQSCHQRLRWCKGGFNVFAMHGSSLIKGFIKKHDFTFFDFFISLSPVLMFSLVGIITNPINTILSFAALMLFYGFLSVIPNWNRINAKAHKKILYTFTFPIFMITYLPISFIALFRDVQWTPISHGCVSNSNKNI